MSRNRIVAGISRRFGRVFLAGAFAAVVGAFAGCSTGGSSGPVNVPLTFRPGNAAAIGGTISASDVKVHLVPVEDKRDNKEQIGQNVENEGAPVPVYASDKTPMEFYQNVIEGELKNFGLELVEAPEAADRIVAIELNRFWVEEGNNYRGDVQATAQVSDKGGRVLWKGKIPGDGKTFGRSRNPANYNLVLSDATRRSVAALVNNPGFQQALTR